MNSRHTFARALPLALAVSLGATIAFASPPGQAAPAVSGVNPWVVAPGQAMTVSGNHFSLDQAPSDCNGAPGVGGIVPHVLFLDPVNPDPTHPIADVQPASPNASDCSDTALKVAVPGGLPGAARVMVRNSGGGGTSDSNYNLEITIQPSASISPTTGGLGTTVTVHGTNLHPPTVTPGSTMTLSYGSYTDTYQSWGDQLTLTPHAQSPNVVVNIKVSTDANNASGSQLAVQVAAGHYTFLPPALGGGALPPATVGNRITLTGRNLGASGSVTFSGGAAGQSVTWAANQVQVTVPPRAQSGPITVNVATDNYGPVQSFDNGQPTLVVLPLINSVSPGSATAGATIHVGGYNFGGKGTITMGGAAEPTSSWSDTLVVFTLSTDADSGVVTLTRGDGQAAQGPTLIVVPHLSKLETSSAPPGTAVVLDGLSFGASQGTVTVGSQQVPTQLWSRSSVLFSIPNLKPGSYHVVLSSATGQVSNALTLQVTAQPTAAPGQPAPAVATSPFFDLNHQFHKPPKPASPVDLNLTIDPHSVPAGSTADITVTLKLNGKPVSGAAIKLSMIFSPGTDYAFTPDSGDTDANGMFKATVRVSKSAGSNIILAQSGVFSDQDQVIGTSVDKPGTPGGAAASGGSVRNPADWGSFLPLLGMAVLAAGLVAGGLFINLRSHRA